jgi:WD40 repeat protein
MERLAARGWHNSVSPPLGLISLETPTEQAEPMNMLKVLYLGVIWVGLVATSPLSAQVPELRATLKGYTNPVHDVAFSPDSKTLASGGSGGPKNIDYEGIKLWDVAMGKEKATLKEHTKSVESVAFSSDGKTLASGSADQTIKLWDMQPGKEKLK